MVVKGKILWVDDEIDLLRSHIIFLEERGYQITPVTNADDALTLISSQNFDMVLLDEMMPGKDGLTALGEIKEDFPSLPVVMVTKNEEESLMVDAIGSKIDDYLTKPVNPSQILLTCKKILESNNITRERISMDYISKFNEISQMLHDVLSWQDWIKIHTMLCEWEIESDQHRDMGLKQTLRDQERECNIEFAKFIEKKYPLWLNNEDAPTLSTDLVKEFLVPLLNEKRNVVFLVIDNLRLDQWLTIAPLLYPYFNLKKEIYYSILPTATPFSRNAIFSGLFPSEIEARYPELWSSGLHDELSLNRHEHQLFDYQLADLGVQLKPASKYVKILDVNEAKNVVNKIASFSNIPLLSIVINFVDILAHSRSDSEVLREIAPDESAYRSLTKSWFDHSYIFQILKELSKRNNTVVITSDHGSVRGMRGAKVIGDRETSTNLRYKVGKSLKVDPKHAIIVKDPSAYKLPSIGINSNYLIAKENFYFVYPTNYHYYLNYFKDSLQHGGVSMEEMILPVVTLEPKKG